MKKYTVLLVFLLVAGSLSAQKYISKNGHVWFYSHTPLEEIKAHNRQVASILDITTGDLTFSLLQKSFEFKIALMQEHFNENYMESDKFPKASFKGKITANEKINYKKDGVYEVEVKGDITLHGVTKSIVEKGTIEVKGETIIAKSKFTLAPKDFDIKIPSLVENKIAKEMAVTLDINYSLYK